MKDLGEEHLGVPSKDAVITVPRYPTDPQRRDTHTRRTTITTSDIDKALRVLNIEAFMVIIHTIEKITLPKGVSWTAHWLAVEGVQLLIPENPLAIRKVIDQDITKSPPQTNGTFPLTPPSESHSTVKKEQQQQQQQLVKQVLSREL
jgi:transcription initiation factor TFIID subunit 6